MSFPRYEAYKDSRVEWLGEVPEHWDLCLAKYVCQEITDGSHTAFLSLVRYNSSNL
jgi:hypothetical protein